MSKKLHLLRRVLPLAALLAGSSVTSVDARAEPVADAPDRPTIALRRTSLMLPDAIVMVVSGHTASGCPPTLGTVEQGEHELLMQTVDSDRQCGPERQRYALRSTPGPMRPGVWRLRHEHRESATATPRLQAFRLVDLDDPRPRPIPEAGFWWGEQGGEFDAAGPGFGVQLELQGDTVALVVSGYDADGLPIWLFGAAPLDGHATTVALARLHGGRGPHEAFRGPDGAVAAGRVHIEWLSSARAVFWFEQPASDGNGITLQPVSMVRFGFGSAAGQHWQGRWLLGPRRSDTGADDTIVPRTLDFVRFEATADGFLLDTASGERLDCRTDPSRNGSPPTLCRLEAFGLPPIEFADIGLNRLVGASADQQAAPVVLLRLDR